MLSDDELKIRDLHNIPIANIKKLMPDVIHKEKYVLQYEKFT